MAKATTKTAKKTAAATAEKAADKDAKVFKDAGEAARAGLPETLTVEQAANLQRRAVLGY